MVSLESFIDLNNVTECQNDLFNEGNQKNDEYVSELEERSFSSRKKKSSEHNQDITLDKLYGQNFKVVSVDETGFEGSAPPNFFKDLLEYEINEIDEDMYSELESRNDAKRKAAVKEQSFIEKTVLIEDADEKIKKKIIAKYSKKKGKQQQQQQQQQQQPSMDNSDVSDNNSTKMPVIDSPTTRSSKTIFPNFEQHSSLNPHQRQESSCNSQSPLRSFNDSSSKSQNQLILRGSQTNFYQTKSTFRKMDSNYEDTKNVENHIAFRNSFYNQRNKQRDLLKANTVKIQREDDFIRGRIHQNKINEIVNKEEEKIAKYVNRFKLNQDSLFDQKNNQNSQQLINQ